MLCMFRMMKELETVDNYEPPKAQRTKDNAFNMQNYS